MTNNAPWRLAQALTRAGSAGRILLIAILLVVSPSAYLWADTITLRTDLWCPYSCDPGSDRPGILTEIALAALEGVGHTVDYRVLSWSRAIRMVRLGDADVLLGAYRTDVPDFVFHERPAVFSRMLFWTHTDNDWEFDGIESLKGVKIGIIKGYSYGDSLDAYLAANPKQVQEGYGSDALGSLVKRLERRRVDVIIEDDWVISYYLKSNPEMQTLRMAGGVEGVPVFIPLSPANPERSGRLAQLIDAGIEALQESGEMSRIYEKYGVGVAHSVGTVGAKTGDD